MKERARVIKSEFRRIIYMKGKLIFFVVISLLLLTLLSLYFYNNANGYDYDSNYHSFEANKANYEEYRDSSWQEYQYELYPETRPEPKPDQLIVLDEIVRDAEYYYNQFLYYDYLLENEKSAYDFIGTDTFSRDSVSNDINRGTNTVLHLNVVLPFFMIALAIIIAISVIVVPYKNGFIRNYVQAPIKKGNVFVGKLTCCFVLYAIITFVVYMLSLAFVLTDETAEVLVLVNSQYKSVSILSFIGVKMIGTFLLMVVFSSILAAMSAKIKSTNALSISIFLLVLVPACLPLVYLISSSNLLEPFLRITPFYNLILGAFHFAEWQTWVMFMFYSLVVAISTFLGYRFSNKRFQEGGYEN